MKYSLVAFPATTLTLTWYAQFLSRKLKAHSSLESYLSAAKKLHVILGFSTRGFRGIGLKLTLLGLKRSNRHITRRAVPVTPTILKLIHQYLNMNKSDDLVFWCACLVAFFLLFRKSNLLPDTKNGFNPRKQLTHGDCVHINGQMVVGIRWAKNVQFKRELLTFPLPRLQGSVLCPVSAILKLKAQVKHKAGDHLFKLSTGKSLTYRAFQQKFRDTLKLAGVNNYRSFSSYSFRRGGTTFCFLSGVPTEIIRLLGNWRSDCFLAYIEFPLETRTAAFELVKFRIKALEDKQRIMNNY